MSPSIRRALPLTLAGVLAASLILSSLASSGLGEPFELDAADRARRFAADVLGARALALDGAAVPPSPPPEVAPGLLPVAAVALAFRVFGLHVWAGRLPMALAALAGVAALAVFLARLLDRRAAAYGVAALAATPLFFVEARTMLGDAISMSASAVACAGLAIAAFDQGGPGHRGTGRAARLAALALGLVGLAAAGLARGLLVGVAPPALAVGVAWVLLRGSGREAGAPHGREPISDAAGGLALLVGAAAFLTGARRGLAGAPPPFDAVLHRVGHAVFPWSAMLPAAFVALLSPPARRGDRAAAREEAARLVVLAGAVAAFAAHALGGGVPFGQPAILAAAVAIAARDLDRRGPEGLREVSAARAAGVATALLTALLARDLLEAPDRALAAIVPLRPGSPLASGGAWLRAAALVFGGVALLASFDGAGRTESAELARRRRISGGLGGSPPIVVDGHRAAGARERAAVYLGWPRALRQVWGGRLLVGLASVEATLVSLALSLALRPARAAALGEVPRLLARHAFWVFPVAVLAVAWVPLAARDLLQAARRRARLPRGGAVIAAGAIAGAMLAWGHYPALLGHLSPRDALTRYAELRGPGEPLGALGVSARAATLEVGAAVRPLADTTAAAAFLDAPAGGPRTWLLLRRDDLPALNALVRARAHRNAAVLAGEGGVLLVASKRLPDDPVGAGALDDLVLSEPPVVAHPVGATIGDALSVLGWDLVDRAGRPLGDGIAPLTTGRLRLYYRVTGRVPEGLCSFVHVDGQGRRFNAEHRDFPRYPIRYWAPGDVVVDEFELALGAHFTPGAYALRFGLDRLPCDGRGRLPVKGARDADDRVVGGDLHVR